MARGHLFTWSAIVRMLDLCAPGWRFELKEHRIWIYYADFPIFRGMPKGGHGKRDAEIQPSHVKALARWLGIWECAQRELDLR